MSVDGRAKRFRIHARTGVADRECERPASSAKQADLWGRRVPDPETKRERPRPHAPRGVEDDAVHAGRGQDRAGSGPHAPVARAIRVQVERKRGVAGEEVLVRAAHDPWLHRTAEHDDAEVRDRTPKAEAVDELRAVEVLR